MLRSAKAWKQLLSRLLGSSHQSILPTLQDGDDWGEWPAPRTFPVWKSLVGDGGGSRDASRVVTLVTQMSWDRRHHLVRTVEAWRGPVSVAVLCKAEDEAAVRELHAQLNNFQGTSVTMELVLDDGRAGRYPVNALRNLALAAALTDLVLLSDCDLTPSDDLVEWLSLKDVQMSLWKRACGGKEALVVPAFEPHPGAPLTSPAHQAASHHARGSFLWKDDLCTWLGDGSCAVFQSQQFSPGHGASQSSLWAEREDDEGYITAYEDGYEPYVIVCRWLCPPYDERYNGYGRNKVQHLRHLWLLGFTFRICTRGFLMHQPHPPSTWRAEFLSKDQGRLKDIKRLDAHAAAALAVHPSGYRPNLCPSYSRAVGCQRLCEYGAWHSQCVVDAAEKILGMVKDGKSLYGKENEVARSAYMALCSCRIDYTQGRGWSCRVLQAGSGESERVAMVTHCSADRLASVCRAMLRWKGPMVVSVLSNGPASAMLGAFLLTAFALVTGSPRPRVVSVAVRGTRRLYPSNAMRQAALQSTLQEYAFVVDVDIEASPGLPVQIAAALPDDGDRCVVHVIPTFEAADSSWLAEALQSGSCVERLQRLWMDGRISAFHATTFPEGHRATNHQQWLDVGAAEGVGGGRGYSTEYEEGFEPYCVVHTATAQAMSPVLYDERFLHPHLDKVAFGWRLAAAGWKWRVLGGGCFAVACSSEPSAQKRREREPKGDAAVMWTAQALYETFKHETTARLQADNNMDAESNDEASGEGLTEEQWEWARVGGKQHLPRLREESSEAWDTQMGVVGRSYPSADEVIAIVQAYGRPPKALSGEEGGAVLRVCFSGPQRGAARGGVFEWINILPDEGGAVVGFQRALLRFSVQFSPEFCFDRGSGKLPGVSLGKMGGDLLVVWRWDAKGRLFLDASDNDRRKGLDGLRQGTKEVGSRTAVSRGRWHTLTLEVVMCDMNSRARITGWINSIPAGSLYWDFAYSAAAGVSLVSLSVFRCQHGRAGGGGHVDIQGMELITPGDVDGTDDADRGDVDSTDDADRGDVDSTDDADRGDDASGIAEGGQGVLCDEGTSVSNVGDDDDAALA